MLLQVQCASYDASFWPREVSNNIHTLRRSRRFFGAPCYKQTALRSGCWQQPLMHKSYPDTTCWSRLMVRACSSCSHPSTERAVRRVQGCACAPPSSSKCPIRMPTDLIAIAPCQNSRSDLTEGLRDWATSRPRGLTTSRPHDLTAWPRGLTSRTRGLTTSRPDLAA